MTNFKISAESKMLFDSLIKQGLYAELEYWDGHKHVDIHIPSAKLYIEVDGPHHFTNPDQIASDFMRDHYSDHSGYDTFRIPNTAVKEQLEKVVLAICKIVEKKESENRI